MPIRIYKASAGSGKTYALTKEYIKLALKDNFYFKHILAVTFTNKAANEMKCRIISKLNELATKSNTGFFDEIAAETGIKDNVLQDKAKKILKNILHDYSYFAVGTIDNFFQNIIKSFVHELGLPHVYNIELDSKKVLGKAVEQVLLNLDKNPELLLWLTNFTMERIDDNKGWNTSKAINEAGKEIFTETYRLLKKDISEKIGNKEFMAAYHKELYAISTNFETTLQNHALQAMNIISSSGLCVEDFSFKKSGVGGYFKRLSEGLMPEPKSHVKAAYENAEAWYSKTSDKKEQIISAQDKGLVGLLKGIIDFYFSNIHIYNTVKIIGQFKYTMSVLNETNNEITSYLRENNLFLLSDAGEMLMRLINDDDAPFIYEKAGTRYHNYMIDEFQDTSAIQWRNFLPLVLNSNAEGNTNIVVGDVKQSIYRWRNSSWEILEYGVKEDTGQGNTETINLNFNWRSKKNIIDFNNAIFKSVPDILQNKYNETIDQCSFNKEEIDKYKTVISDVFDGQIQEIPDIKNKDKGYVRLAFIDKNEENDWKTNALLQIPDTIDQLLENKYNKNDIAILVRSKDDGRLITEYLLSKNIEGNRKYRYDIISDETLYISDSGYIQIIITALKHLAMPGDKMNTALLISLYQNYVLNNKNIFSGIYDLKEEKSEIVKPGLPPAFTEKKRSLSSLPLYEITEQIIDIFGLSYVNGAIAYLSAFQDQVLDFCSSNNESITGFLEWWEDSGLNKSVVVPGEQDAITIITIHKSKGLEFGAVIIPFCDWNIDHNHLNKNIIWCQPENEPFNKLKAVPVAYSQIMAQSLFYREYFKEKLYAYIDNLNLLYVAFTRTRDNLFVSGPHPDDKKKFSGTVFSAIYESITASGENDFFKKHWDEKTTTFSYGSLQSASLEEKDNKEEMLIKNYSVILPKDKLILSLRNNDFFATESKSDKINFGKIMHEIIELVDVTKDIDSIIRHQIQKGLINEGQSAKIKDYINDLLYGEDTKEWFNGNREVKKEAEILLPDGSFKRPDRVLWANDKTIVIDFKFGDAESNEYKNQVIEYTEQIRKMGYENIEGYLWYAHNKKKERVV